MVKVDSLPISERHREKAIIHGVSSLSNAELLALLIRSGYKNMSVIDLSYHLLTHFNGLNNLQNTSLVDLMKIKGIKKAKAIELAACFEIAKRINDEKLTSNLIIKCSKDIFDIFHYKLKDEKQEQFIVVFLNSKNKIITYKKIFIGGLEYTLVHPRDIFREAIKNNAKKIICIHNHPSGEVRPSEQDILTTLNLIKLGNSLGIEVSDHIIIGQNNYYSLKEEKDI